MKDHTRFLNDEFKKDVGLIWQHNNSKIAKRTPEQNEQARRDRMSFYLNKWNGLASNAETKAQKNIFERMIDRINHTPKFF